MTLKQGTLFPATLIPELISKVQGHSVLAKLSTQTPIPFNGTEQFIFNLNGNAQIVGEGDQKKAGDATLTSKVIKPLKFVYQTRITNEFMYASDEKKINYLQAFADGFAKKIAEAFDIAAIHGLEPKALTDASFRSTNSFDGVIDGNLVDYVAENIDDNIEAAVQAVRAKGGDVTGLALSPTAGGDLGKLKDANKSHIFPEFRFGQNPDSFYGMKSDINKTLVQEGGTAKKDHAIVGDFENMFKWGYAENIPMEVIEYGDPDGAGRDLKAYNEVCLRAEAFIGWGILDKDSFAIVKED
ncbi:phage structural protein [Streptococcus pyogenes]|uniref:phage major capsid protein n=1 Tax=Streptococcus pyogenes TaxID=1314 RepID=UPI0010A0D965|nr:phage major capsid protein [Streptococcus pyogenes]VGQ32318.1 phage structural protein [Streptococcus pyogenes]VGQ66712.1 phage structural protein [Streptococcus pyogenes]VGQ97969.1 phage structural protein [Streptococcus pyogenes]VGQ99919.1 phage structural protein [Streptococcus pyogenes]VGW04912.1 phage structural protein [Streptococcus pyogenes]